MKTVTKLDALPKIERKKRVAAYVRVSCEKQTMRHSLSAQVSYYSAWIQRRIDWAFAGVYADDPISGTKDNRVEFQRLLADCRAGKIDMIITKSISRFARNTLVTLAILRELKELEVNVFFERENIHSISGEGELLLSLLASFAQEESRSVSENCKWRIRKWFQQGRPNTGHMLGYRLKAGKLHIVSEEAKVVRQIFADYLSGMGRQAIVKKLNAEGIPTKMGGAWMESTIDKILHNEKYAGDLVLQKTFVKDHITKKKCINRGELPKYHIQSSHEAIIPRETFRRVQQEIAKRAAKYQPRPQTPIEYPFSSLIICEKCGKHYRRKHAAAGTKYEKVVWICNTFNTLGKAVCDSQQIPETILLAKTADILGLTAFDEAVFKAQIAEIRVPAHNTLVYVRHDGIRILAHWQNPSRARSWTPEMKQAAREHQNKIIEERKRQNEN